MLRVRVYLILIGGYICALAAGQEACSGHGKLLPSGDCECENGRPAPESRGWAGRDCSIPMFGGSLDGEDMADWCRESDHCDKVDAGSWTCHYADFIWECVAQDELRNLREQLPFLRHRISFISSVALGRIPGIIWPSS